MESIDALAKAVNEFSGGLVLVSHDMRLISQIAKEIWICDNKTITRFQGDIQSFKMELRATMELDGDTTKLKGDASVRKKEGDNNSTKAKEKPAPKPKLEVVAPPKLVEEDDATRTTASSSLASNGDGGSRYVPPHLRKKMQES